MTPCRVVVIDDSPTMRGLIAALLKRDPEIEVVGFAADPYEARQVIKDVSPDVITLDVEMPRMDGLSFLEKIMRLRPMPVIMVSTLTDAGAAASIRALQLGAFDCIGKPASIADREAFDRLPALVKAARESNIANQTRHAAPGPAGVVASQTSKKMISIGSSTGGVEALMTILKRFPADCPPTVITQHMPPNFTKTFADRLNKSCAPDVAEAQDLETIGPGQIRIAPGGQHHLTVEKRGGLVTRLRPGDPVSGHRPSVDVLFRSVADAYGPDCIGLILTGMGGDGAEGLLAMRQRGAATYGQDEKSCVVYGMPRVAQSLGAVERELSLEKIAEAVLTTGVSGKGIQAA